jgi:hypothetical protein
LAHVNMTISNVRVDKYGKVKGVNYNPNIGRYDVRYVKQLPNTDSKGRTAFNVHIKSYENIDDATVAVVLLESKLGAISDGGVNTRFGNLKMITDKIHRKKKISELSDEIEQEVKNMNKARQVERNLPVAEASWGSNENSNLPVVTPEIDAGALGAVLPFTFALVLTLDPIPGPALSSYFYPGRRARCDVVVQLLGRDSRLRQQQSPTSGQRRTRRRRKRQTLH